MLASTECTVNVHVHVHSVQLAPKVQSIERICWRVYNANANANLHLYLLHEAECLWTR